jgi:hypothetical protein
MSSSSSCGARLSPALREELDDARELIRRFKEHAEDYTSCIEQWKEAFGMEDTGHGWT